MNHSALAEQPDIKNIPNPDELSAILKLQSQVLELSLIHI